MRPELSVQLYSVRHQLAENPEATLQKLAEMGFGSVEAFGLPLDSSGLKKALIESGLKVPTAHGSVAGSRNRRRSGHGCRA